MLEKTIHNITLFIWISAMFGLFLIGWADTKLPAIGPVDNYIKGSTYTGDGFYGADLTLGYEKVVGRWKVDHRIGHMIIYISETGTASIDSVKDDSNKTYASLLWSISRDGKELLISSTKDHILLGLDEFRGGMCHTGSITTTKRVSDISICKLN